MNFLDNYFYLQCHLVFITTYYFREILLNSALLCTFHSSKVDEMKKIATFPSFFYLLFHTYSVSYWIFWNWNVWTLMSMTHIQRPSTWPGEVSQKKAVSATLAPRGIISHKRQWFFTPTTAKLIHNCVPAMHDWQKLPEFYPRSTPTVL